MNPITGVAGCCVRAASGQAAAEPAIAVMNSRRHIALPQGSGARQQWLITSGICDQRNGVQGLFLHGSNPEPSMSALGQKRTWQRILLMSALSPKADIKTDLRNPLAKMQRIFEFGFLLMAFRRLVVLAK